MDRTISVISLGCPKNLVDSEIILGKLSRYHLTQIPEDADIIIINTCSFIKDARRESYNVIKKFNKQKIIVTGCLPQLLGDKLFKKFPQIDAILGSADFYKIDNIIDRLFNGDKKIISIEEPTFIYNHLQPRLISTSSYAYVKIADGCINYCSYCRIPQLRGKYRSREIKDIVQEVHKIRDLGIKEIILVAQDTTNYGIDKGNYLLSELLCEIEKIDGIEWIRLLYTHPAHLTDNLISIIKESKKLCKYIDIPIQHTHNEILKLMNRPTWDDTKYLIYKLKEANIVLRTTIIVGFPGEKEYHFKKLLKDVDEIKFDWLGAFIYSKEKGTPAAKLPNQVPENIKKERFKILMDRQRKITKEKNHSRIGKEFKILVDAIGEGHTEFQCPELDGKVIFSTSGTTKFHDVRIGNFFTAKIKKVKNDYDLEI